MQEYNKIFGILFTAYNDLFTKLRYNGTIIGTGGMRMKSYGLYRDASAQFTMQPRTLVCVTDQMNCSRIIRAGRVLADLNKTSLSVISVASTKVPQDPASIEHLFDVSRQSGADMSVIYADDSAKAIIRYIKENKISHVLTGEPTGENSPLYRIWTKFTHIRFYTVDSSGAAMQVARQSSKGSAVTA
jgi:K+-sensing histidine kinase KdpD